MKTKRTITELVDDFDGSPDAKTVTFAVDGTRYEIELGPVNQAEFIETLQPYIDRARKIGNGTKKKSKEPNSKEVRAWASEAGVEVNPTGRVPKAVIEQYKAAH